MMPLASLFVSAEKTSTGELTGEFLDLEATYMAMHSKGGRPSKQKIDWTQYDRQQPTSLPLPNVKTLLQNPAYSLLLHSFLPEISKRYRSKEDHIHLYLLARGTAILVEDKRLLLFGDDTERVGQMLQQSLDLYDQLGQPLITEYSVTLKVQQAVIRVRDHCFQLPLLV